MANHILANSDEISLMNFGGLAFYIFNFEGTDNIAIIQDYLSIPICIAYEIVDDVITEAIEERTFQHITAVSFFENDE